MRVNPYAAALLMLSLTVAGYASGNQKERQPWYGTLTIDSVPFAGCEVVRISPFSGSWSFSNGTPEFVRESFKESRTQLENEARAAGFHALVGFQIDWMGGAGALNYTRNHTQYHDVMVTGVMVLSATGVELRCK